MDRRLLLGIGAIVLIGAAFFVIRSQSTKHAAVHRTFHLAVVKGTTMTPDTIAVTQGDTVTLSVTSDTAFELHLHGYNRKLEVKPGKANVETFRATISGSFEMENEGMSHHLATLSVNPS